MFTRVVAGVPSTAAEGGVSHLTEAELDQLLRAQAGGLRQMMVRLLAELRELRDQAGERERMAAEEREI